MAPAVGRSKPANKFSSVDFPEPELPSNARNSPSRTDRDTSSTARISASPILYWRETCSARIASPLADCTIVRLSMLVRAAPGSGYFIPNQGQELPIARRSFFDADVSLEERRANQLGK